MKQINETDIVLPITHQDTLPPITSKGSVLPTAKSSASLNPKSSIFTNSKSYVSLTKKGSIPLKHPQEIEVWYVIPAIRKALALDLIKSGKSQRQVAFLLGVTEAAVSNYIKKKRAKDIDLPNEVKEFVNKVSVKIVDKRSAYYQVQQISNFVKESKALCKMHFAIEDGVEENCNVCYEC
jgi:uncharacterized protein